ncbi:phosphotransferase [Phlyctema vagabunda]|uniref:Phosphotransferase n=1 Tax=Phlyctema vagabunda TaxID=108571 RepID=A0ABR4PN16_9HELO
MAKVRENARQDFDELAWDKNDEEWEVAQKAFSKKSLCRRLELLVAEKFGKPATWITPMIIGGFNHLYRIRVEDLSRDVLVRRPSVSQSQFPEEKTLREAATAKYIQQNTQVPTPLVFFYSDLSDVGPFIIIEHIENKSTLSHALTTPGVDRSVTHALDPNISPTMLEDLYLKVATIIFELSRHKFPQIGSLLEGDDGSFSVRGRPITQNMSDMLQLANIPSNIFSPEYKTFQSSDEYYLNLARGHLVQLAFQYNDLVKSADDCRNKYVARQLFYQLAKQGRLSVFGFAEDDWSSQARNETSELLPRPSNTDSFRLYGDDFRPGNILINDVNEAISVIDWEFTYTAPTQFALDPPWWLLLDTPEMWDDGIDDWVKNYEPRLETWLSAIKKVEESASSESTELLLSAYMGESWKTGRFWLTYAARKSWAFDTIFWKYLDERFFGRREYHVKANELWKTRMHLLSEGVRTAMEPFVQRKVEEMKVRKLVDWDLEAAKSRLAGVLFEQDK